MMHRLSFLRSSDVLSLVFLAAITVLELLFAPVLPDWPLYTSANIAIIIAVLFSARMVAVRGERAPIALRIVRDWYLLPLVLLLYMQSSSITFPIHQRDMDQTLIAIDRSVLGVDPTVWIRQFAHPVLTEILQICYSSYYLFFVALFYELYLRTDRHPVELGALLVVYGFYLSFIGYLLVPAIGPRFTLHDFRAIGTELPGLFLTPYLRAFIDSGGGVPAGALDPAQFVHRDAFPSGHTQLTLVAMYLAFHFKTRIRWGLLVVGSLLIVSTIYMGYHYVTDLAAGVLFFLFTIWTGPKVDRWWREGIKNV